jgi:hypothetical protein
MGKNGRILFDRPKHTVEEEEEEEEEEEDDDDDDDDDYVHRVQATDL